MGQFGLVFSAHDALKSILNTELNVLVHVYIENGGNPGCNIFASLPFMD